MPCMALILVIPFAVAVSIPCLGQALDTASVYACNGEDPDLAADALQLVATITRRRNLLRAHMLKHVLLSGIW